MIRRATIKDVAAHAGVSLKTVSRVVNGEPGVSAAVALRVGEAVTALHYRPHLGASSLRRGARTLSVGVLLHDLRNAYSATLLRSIELATRPRGIAVFSVSLEEDDEREALLAADLVSRRVDGLVLMPTSADQSYLLPEVSAGLAVVAVDRLAHGVEVDTVLTDSFNGARQATLHLLEHGHRRIACLLDRPTIWTSTERLKGYRTALGEWGVAVDESLVVTGLATSAAAAAATADLLGGDSPPTALFTARNDLTIGAVSLLHARGLALEVALVGFDDFPLSDVLSPPVTLVNQDVEAVGTRVADLLLSRLDHASRPAQQEVLPTTLLVRGSGEIRPRAPQPHPTPSS